MAKTKITAADVRMLLHEKYSDHRQFAYAEEVGNATGYEQERRLDMVVVNVYKSSGYSIEGIEVKVSRADLRRELMDSSKHNIFYEWLDFYSLATTESVLKATKIDEEIPAKWGIYCVYDNRQINGTLSLSTYRKPLCLHDEQSPAIDRPFFASLMRALCNQTPAATAIEAAYKEGEAAAAKKYEAKLAYSDAAQIDKLKEDLRAYEELRNQIGLWGAGDIERGIEKYKALTAVDLRRLDYSLSSLASTIKELRASIPDELKSKF